MKCSVYIVCPSVISNRRQTLEVKNIFKQENIMLQLTFNPGLTLTGFRTTRSWFAGCHHWTGETLNWWFLSFLVTQHSSFVICHTTLYASLPQPVAWKCVILTMFVASLFYYNIVVLFPRISYNRKLSIKGVKTRNKQAILKNNVIDRSKMRYSGIPISRTLGFPNLPISRTKPCFPWICFTQALQSHPRFLEPSISRNSR